MRSNPGGQLAPGNIVGRDKLVAQMWTILRGRSIYMNDLRRVGKTMILDKMQADPPPGWLVIKRDLEGLHTAAEFATQAYRDSEELLSKTTLGFRRMRELLGGLKGAEIGGILKLPNGSAAPWKDVLRRTFSDLEEQAAAADNRIVFLWDEVPFLVGNVKRREGAATAMEILDMLRSLSQDCRRTRFVLTGSVGLHHVLSELRSEGYSNSPLNQMERVAPGPLAPEDAESLALELLRGEGFSGDESKACAKTVADAVGNVPFYIHKLISRLPKGQPLDPTLIEAALGREIAHPDNDWDLTHYRNRLQLYYAKDEKLVLGILDAVAASETPLSFEAILKQISSQTLFEDQEHLRNLLKLLGQDHYLQRDASGGYTFRFPLIRRWWRLDRGLKQP
ncbi:MAG: hypothetical protein ACLQVX_17120 [Limisphaerales bacterium]